MDWFTSLVNPHDDPVIHWQSLVDRGLIGRRTETPPEIAANRARTEAILLAPHRRTPHNRTGATRPRREPGA